MSNPIDDNKSTMTMDQLKKSGLKIKDSRKVNMRYKCLKLMDAINNAYYGNGTVQLTLQKQGYSIERKDLEEAMVNNKAMLTRKYLDGKTTKELSGSMAALKKILDETLAMP